MNLVSGCHSTIRARDVVPMARRTAPVKPEQQTPQQRLTRLTALADAWCKAEGSAAQGYWPVRKEHYSLESYAQEYAAEVTVEAEKVQEPLPRETVRRHESPTKGHGERTTSELSRGPA